MNTVLSRTNFIRLPKGFTARGATFEDAEQSCRLMNRWTQSILGMEEKENSEAILREWKSPDFDPARDICLVFAPNNELAGYIEVWATFRPAVHPGIWGRVDPDYEGYGHWLVDAEVGGGTCFALPSHTSRGCAFCPANRRAAPGREIEETIRGFWLSICPQFLQDDDRAGHARPGAGISKRHHPADLQSGDRCSKPSIVPIRMPSVTTSALWKSLMKRA